MKATASAWKRFLLCFTCGLVWLGSGPPASAAETTASEPTTTGGGLTVLDWIVLGAYAVGMLLIGYYYSRRTRSADDYLLGGRVMKPWMVGLSMFATFLSVLTYLALPGEMIAHGPMMLAQVLGFPVVALVVCWLIIPYIMRFRVTSGYEILEARFGESVRLLGATMFLLVRFLWMGLVIYATVDKVFVPVLGLDQAWVPAVCAVVGLITVIYSSMGGLRAVVLSDAIQAIILCSGAVLAVVLITVSLGSVSDWWPTEWQTHWDPRRYWFSPTSRMDVASVVTGVVLWWVATAGSGRAIRATHVQLLHSRQHIPCLYSRRARFCLAGLFSASSRDAGRGPDDFGQRRSIAAALYRRGDAGRDQRAGDCRPGGRDHVESFLRRQFGVVGDYHRPDWPLSKDNVHRGRSPPHRPARLLDRRCRCHSLEPGRGRCRRKPPGEVL